MGKNVKFASQVDEATLEELRTFAKESGISISKALNDAITDYLKRARIRDEFRKAAESVVDENQDLLKRLAK